MTTAEIAKLFSEHLKAGDTEAAEKYWSDDIVSVEAMEGPMHTCRGLAEVQAKSAWFYNAHDVHAFVTHGPYVNGDQFTLRFIMDLTQKETGQRVKSEEIALYTVKDGRIIEERFFY